MGMWESEKGTTGGTAAQLPEGFQWRTGNGGALELWKTNVTPEVLITEANVGEFDVNGSLRAAINTIYLEDAHSIKSSGEEVVFKNLESSVYYTPLWQFTSEDGESVGEASVLVEEGSPTDYFQNGTTPSATISVPCNDTYTTTDNGSVYQFIAVAAEAYTGPLKLELRNSIDKAVFRDERQVSLSAGQNVVFDKLLYRVRIGNVRTFSLIKQDGSKLLVRAGQDTTKPWVKVVYRGFQDRRVVHVDASGKIPTADLPQIDTVERSSVPNQAARLALPVSAKFRITIQTDVQRQFYLDPGANPSVAGNWVDGGSVASAVTSFNGRTGNVTPQQGDYTAEQIGALPVPAADGVRRVLIGQTPTAEVIVDNLTSTATGSPLSANMGKQLQDTKQANITGAASTVTSTNLSASRVLVSDSAGKIAASSSVTALELSYLDGATSNVQEQINAKQATINGAATTIVSTNLTADRALISDANGKVAVHSTVSSTELSYLDGATKNIQTQLADGWFARTTSDTLTGDKSIVDMVPIATASGTVTPAMIPWKMPGTTAGRAYHFAWMLNRIAALIGALDNDRSYDGLFSTLLASAASDSTLMKAAWPSLGGIDVDQGSSSTPPVEAFKMILGRDASSIYWVNVVGWFNSADDRGLRYETGSNVWGNAQDGAFPLIRSSSQLTAGTATFSDALINSSWPALCVVPIRLELY